jgi:hypothetical protein
MRSVVAIAPSRVVRTVLVPEVLPADASDREPAAMLFQGPLGRPTALAVVAEEYAEAPVGRRGDLLDVYC